MTCAECGRELPTDSAFCLGCGTPQTRPCTHCGALLPADATFCNRCGNRVDAASVATTRPGAAAERRLTSVLFADLVSYTSMSEDRDTEDVRELLTAYFDVCSTVVRRYGGTVEKFIGDAVMAVWGVPVAHEDDAERAVRAGLELVTEIAGLGERLGVPQLSLRVGIVSGEVAATLGAVDQGMVAGDAVNTAARVQSLAPSGDVWVDDATRALTVSAVSYEEVGEHLLKGKAAPVRLHRAVAIVAALGGAQRVDGLEAPLVGRDRDLRLLKELFHSAEESRRPHLVVVDGEGGIGKTRLAWELEKYADGLSRTIRWHRGRCLSYGDGIAYWALSEAVRGRLGVVGDEAGVVVLAALDQVLQDNVADDEERGWLRARVASLLGEESRDFAREDLFAAWTRFFERIAGDDPMVLVVDDAQHLDEGLAEFLDFLVTRAAFGCFVVLLARPDLLEQRPHLGGRRATPLRLEPLRDDDMGLLVDGLVDGLPADLRAALVERAGGIPLYAVETVRALIDRDLVVPSGGRYVVSGADLDLETLGPPATLHALVAARLDALDPDEHRVLSDASVLGEAFTREGVGILCADVPALDAVLESLIRKELLAVEVDRFSAERGSYRFVQTVVRQVAYGTLARRDRRARHLAVADHLERDIDRAEELARIVAQHLLDAAASSSADDPEVADLRGRAGSLMVRAGERAFALGAYADAARSFAAALDWLTDARECARVLRRRSQALNRLGRFDDALPDAERSVALYDEAGDVLGAAESARELSEILGNLDRARDGIALCEERLGALDALGHDDRVAVERVRSMLLSSLATGYLFTGRWRECEAPLMESLRISNRVDDLRTFLASSNALAIYQSRYGSVRIARTLLRGMIDDARAAEQWLFLSISQANLAVFELNVDLDEAVRLTDEAIDTADGHGLGVDDPLLGNLAIYSFAAGRWDRTRAAITRVREAPVPMRLSAFVASAVTLQLRWAGADVPVDVPAQTADYEGFYSGIQEFHDGSVALGVGDLGTAAERLWAAARLEADQVGLAGDLGVMWPLATWVAVDHGRLPDELASLVRRVLDEENQGSSLTSHAHVFGALLAAPEEAIAPEQVESGFREGIAGLERCHVRTWAARSREELGRWLVSQGRAEEGALELAAAEAAYASFGATAWVRRVEAARGLAPARTVT